MWIVMLLLLLLGAQVNLSALVPLQVGDTPPPWWVGGRLVWPFAAGTRTLIPPGDVLNSVTPLLAITSAVCFLLAAAALLRWFVPAAWFPWLIAAGAIFSIPLQVICVLRLGSPSASLGRGAALGSLRNARQRRRSPRIG